MFFKSKFSQAPLFLNFVLILSNVLCLLQLEKTLHDFFFKFGSAGPGSGSAFDMRMRIQEGKFVN